MNRQLALLLAAIVALAALGCARPKVWVPPRIDLGEYGTLGLIEVRSPSGYGPIATRQLLASLHGAQAGVPVLELGTLEAVLESVEHAALGPDAARAIGERYGVDALVVGDLVVDAPRPSFSIHSFTEASASADLQGTLDARILDARSGATVWSDRARGARSIAHLDMATGRRPYFGAVDPEGEQAKLVAWLVGSVTRDFRGHWARP